MLSTGVKIKGNNIFYHFNVYLLINKSLTPVYIYIYIYIYHHYLRKPAIRELDFFGYIDVI